MFMKTSRLLTALAPGFRPCGCAFGGKKEIKGHEPEIPTGGNLIETSNPNLFRNLNLDRK